MDFSKDAENVRSSFKKYIVFRNIFKEILGGFLVFLAVYLVTFFLRNKSDSSFLELIFITSTVFVIVASFLFIIEMASLISTFKNINQFSSYTEDFDKNMAKFEKILSDKYNVACALAIGYKVMYNELFDRTQSHIQEKELEKFEKIKTFGGMAEILSTKTSDESLSSLLKTVGNDWAD